jgi:hypothetical protein
MWVVADLDDDYIAKMEDVLEVYERPYDPHQPVICVDEKQVALIKINWKFDRKALRLKFGYKRKHFKRSET